jgi:predicted esterase
VADLNLKSFDKLYPMIIHKYVDLIPSNDATIMDKLNSIIVYLNKVGKLTNDVVKDWNVVYQWVMNDGLTADVSAKIEDMLTKGALNPLINPDLTQLTTADKTSLVHAINENTGKINTNTANVTANTNAIALKADKTYVDTQLGSIGNTKTFKGSTTFASLPTSGNTNGDYYYVTDQATNYCWNNTSWVNIGNAQNIGDGTITIKKVASSAYQNLVINGQHVNATLPFSSSNLIGTAKILIPTQTYNTIEVKCDIKNLSNVNKISIMQGSTESAGVTVSSNISIDQTISGSNVSTNYVYIKFYCNTYTTASFDFENLHLIINGVDITNTITGYSMDLSSGSLTPYTTTFYGLVTQDVLSSGLGGKANTSNFTSDANIADSVIQKTIGRFNSDGSINATQTNWEVSDYIDLTYGATVNSYALNNNASLVLYDSNKNIKTIVTNTTGADGFTTRTLTLTDGAFVRIQSCQGLSKYAYGTQKVMGNFVKTGYASGYIYFQVNINTTFPTNAITNSVLDSETLNYVWCALKLPTTYQATGAPTKLAVCMHGAGGVVYNGNAGELTNYENLVSAGYAILDCAGVVGDITVSGQAEHMGGPKAIQAYLKAIDYVVNNYNVEKQIYLHGHSMGGLTALNFAIQNPEKVKVVACFYPVTDLYNQAWLHSWYGTQTKTDMAKAYNFNDQTGATYEADKVVGFNPVLNHSFSDGTNRYNFFPVPLKIWHGNADTVVDYTGSQTYITNIKNGGGRAIFRIVDGVDHTTVTAMQTEQLYWFNRF